MNKRAFLLCCNGDGALFAVMDINNNDENWALLFVTGTYIGNRGEEDIVWSLPGLT